jgi:FkbM family methyltransferase
LKNLRSRLKILEFRRKNEIVPNVEETDKDPVILTDVWGMRFTCYPYDSEVRDVVVGKEFYKPELLAIQRLVKKGGIAIDIGANIGLFSVFLSKELSAKGHVYAFEPVRDTYWRMKENLVLNRCENVMTYQQAMSNKNGKAVMNIFPAGYGAWNTFGKPQFGEIKPVSKETVIVTTLDEFVRSSKIKFVDFLKIDVEGFEFDVLQGAKNTLIGNKVKYLSFEISETPLVGAKRKGDDIFNILKEYGYQSYQFNPETSKFEGPVFEPEVFYQNFYASKLDMRKI